MNTAGVCSWEAAAKADTIGEQQLIWMQSGSSSWSDRSLSDHARLVFTRDTTAQGCWCVRVRGCACAMQTHADVVKEVRPQKHNYVCRDERTVMRRVVLTRTESSSNFCTAKICSSGDRMDWNIGIAYTAVKSLLESSYSVTSLTCSMPCLGILPWGQRSLHI